MRKNKKKSISACIWGLSYLLLIPICAGIYTYLPNLDSSQFHFYHESAQYEKSVRTDAINVINNFQKFYIQKFKEFYSSNKVEVDGGKVSIEDLKIQALKPRDENEVEIHFRFDKLEKETDSGLIGSYKKQFIAVVTMTGKDRIFLGSGFVCKEVSFEPRTVIFVDEYEMAVEKLFPHKICPQGMLTFSDSLNADIKGFWRATRGFPTYNISGRFLRMLYFSAITITTIGYGDIYPISNIARIIVTTETVLGLVFAGLFLNAIVQGKSTSSNR